VYDAVIFDLFGTLVEDVYISIYQQMAECLGLDESVFRQNWAKDYNARTTGKAHFRESLHFLCQEFDLSVSPDLLRDITDIRVGAVRCSLQSVRPGAVEVLSELSEDGISTGLLSNAALEVVDVWRSSPLATRFDATVFSCTAGTMKPNPEIYRLE
jgi:putative hydrolase of the HAD superfamily